MTKQRLSDMVFVMLSKRAPAKSLFLEDVSRLINESLQSTDTSRLVHLIVDSNRVVIGVNGRHPNAGIRKYLANVSEQPVAVADVSSAILKILNLDGPARSPIETLCGQRVSSTAIAIPIRDSSGGVRGWIVVLIPNELYSDELYTSMRMVAVLIDKNVSFQSQVDALNEKMRYEREIFESISEGVMIIDNNGAIRYLNKRGKEILGVDDRAIGSSLRSITKFEPEILEILETGIGWKNKEFIVDLTTKSNLHLVKTATPIFDEFQSVIGVIDVFTEIKEVRKLVNSIIGARASFTFENIVYTSEEMHQVLELARRTARSDSAILIQGESGTGKELFAHAIHAHSLRADGPFVTIDCSALPHELVESELFGYVEGAFTGARRGGRPGKFEWAAGGTIFLDEVSEMSHELQKRFLRVLQSHSVTRVGDHSPIPVDIRVIAATNKDLELEVHESNFRADLFYRLNVINLHIPALRSRKSDILPTARHFVSLLSPLTSGTVQGLTRETEELFLGYGWPGNVRELKNVVERALNVTNTEYIVPADLPARLRVTDRRLDGLDSMGAPAKEASISTLSESERERIRHALVQCSGNRSEAAHLLGIARSTLYEKMRRHGIHV
jgi:sigma-54 dependent transcriptional regulator, acetoin dehydrogenase operon transcriptional activator AcoR